MDHDDAPLILWRAALLLDMTAQRIATRGTADPCTPALPCEPAGSPVCTRCALEHTARVLYELFDVAGMDAAHATAQATITALEPTDDVAGALQRASDDLRTTSALLTHQKGN